MKKLLVAAAVLAAGVASAQVAPSVRILPSITDGAACPYSANLTFTSLSGDGGLNLCRCEALVWNCATPGTAASASDITVTDAPGYYSSASVEGALSEVGAKVWNQTAERCARFNASGDLEAAAADCNTGTDTTCATPGVDCTLDTGDQVPASLITGAPWLTTEVDGDTSNELQTIDVFTLVGDTLNLSLANDGQANKTLDISGVDNQAASDVAITDAAGYWAAANTETAFAEIGGILKNNSAERCARFDLNGDLVAATSDCAEGTPSVAFNNISGATNTTAAMVLGTGASLTTTGSGTNRANRLPTSANGGFVKTDASGVISFDTSTYLTSEGDGSPTNELQNIFHEVAVSGSPSVTAASTNGTTLTLVAGNNITMTADNTAKSVTINAAASGTAPGSANYIPYNNGSNLFTAEAAFTYNPTTNTLAVDNVATSTIQGTDPGGDLAHLTLYDNNTTCPDPVAGATTICSVNGEWFSKAPGVAARELLSTGGGDYGEITCTSGTCGLDADVVDGTNISIVNEVQGSISYFNGSTWAALGSGSSGQVLTSGGAGANPSWTAVGGTGTITSVGDFYTSGNAFKDGVQVSAAAVASGVWLTWEGNVVDENQVRLGVVPTWEPDTAVDLWLPTVSGQLITSDWADVLDFTNASLKIPAGSNPTVNTVGAIGIDTDDASLHIYDNTYSDTVAVPTMESIDVSILDATDADDMVLTKLGKNTSIRKITCVARGTSPQVSLQVRGCPGADCGTSSNVNTNLLVCNGTEASTTAFTVAYFAAGYYLDAVLTSGSGTIDQLYIKVEYQNRP